MAGAGKIVVTGAAQGIGRAVALRMAAAGACVAVWDAQADGAEDTARLCREAGAQSRAWRVDVAAADEVEAAAAAFEREWGRPDGLVNKASGRALAGAAKGAHYSASKGGIIALTKSLALDWAPYGIRVNCVIPGLTDTAQPRVEMGDNELYAAGARIPMGRIGRPQDIAAVVAFLLSDDAGYMTAQSVAANGGAIMVP